MFPLENIVFVLLSHKRYFVSKGILSIAALLYEIRVTPAKKWLIVIYVRCNNCFFMPFILKNSKKIKWFALEICKTMPFKNLDRSPNIELVLPISWVCCCCYHRMSWNQTTYLFKESIANTQSQHKAIEKLLKIWFWTNDSYHAQKDVQRSHHTQSLIKIHIETGNIYSIEDCLLV